MEALSKEDYRPIPAYCQNHGVVILIGLNLIAGSLNPNGNRKMRSTQQFSITLPLDMAEVIEGKIKSGAYASVSEVMRDGVRALLERDAAVERWLREEVVAGHREYVSDPSKGVTAEALLGRIKARRSSRRR
jgi:antitoxin ParD1/3/4